MKKYLLALVILLTTLGGADARTHHHSRHAVLYQHSHRNHSQIDNSRPSAWCGWQMRQWFGGGSEYNLARNWAHRGTATTPHVGAIVVWPHHVGFISGRTSTGEWIVKSGNDGHRIRERPRSLAGVIAIKQL
jgi:hypothetical protein